MSEALADIVAEAEIPPPEAVHERILGHDTALETIASAFAAGRMPHAWLISGPAGIGKATLAWRMARSLLGGTAAGHGAEEQGGAALFDDLPPPAAAAEPMPEPPADATAARLIAQQAHPDLLSIAREWDEKKKALKRIIPVEPVRRVAPFLRHTASQGGWRIVIIDGAEAMQREGQNAILKILEEPPDSALLMLLTDRPGSLVPTIRSRCRSLALDPLSAADMDSLFDRYLPDIGAGDRADLRRFAESSIGRALSIYEDGGLDIYRELLSLLDGEEIDARALFGHVDRITRGASERAWRITGDCLLWWLRNRVRDAALSGAADAQAWLDLWAETRDRLEDCDRRSLDRRSVMDLLLRRIAG